jgi:hypothetical protein
MEGHQIEQRNNNGAPYFVTDHFDENRLFAGNTSNVVGDPRDNISGLLDGSAEYAANRNLFEMQRTENEVQIPSIINDSNNQMDENLLEGHDEIHEELL